MTSRPAIVVRQRQQLVADAIAPHRRRAVRLVADGCDAELGGTPPRSPMRRRARIGCAGPGSIAASPSLPLPRRRRSSTVSAWSSAVWPVMRTGRQGARGGRRGRGPRGSARRRPRRCGARTAPRAVRRSARRLLGLRGRLGPQPVVDVVGDHVEPVLDGERDQRSRVGAAGEGAGHRRAGRRKRAAPQQRRRAASERGGSPASAHRVARQSSCSLARRPLG